MSGTVVSQDTLATQIASITDDRDELGVTDRGFWSKWGGKLIFSLISVKVWGLVASTWVSTYLALNNFISGGEWVTFNTTVWALVFGMKEIFKISTGREKADKKLATQELAVQSEQSRLRSSVASSLAAGALPCGTEGPRLTPDGKEIVADEPDETGGL